MKHHLLPALQACVLAVLLLPTDINAQGLGNVAYGRLANENGNLFNMECAYSDPSGNVYLAGASKYVGDFSQFDGATVLPSPTAGNVYFYITKYSPTGTLSAYTFLYSNSTSTTSEINIRGVVADNSGNVYVTGFFTGTVDFDGGAGTSNLVSTSGSTFLAKYDASLNLVWAKGFGSPNASNKAVPEDIAISPSTGNVWITGYFIGLASNGTLADVDPGAGTVTLTGVSTSRGGFVSAYTTAGAYVASSVGVFTNNSIAASGTPSAGDDVRPTSIALNSSGKVYIGGYYEVNMLGSGTCTAVSSTAAGFIAAFDPGNTSCSLLSTGTSIEDIGIDASNNVYAAGVNSTTGLLVKYNSSMTLQWTRFPGTAIRSLDIDNSNNIYVAGSSSGAYIQKYNSAGTVQFGGSAGFVLADIPNGFREVQISGGNILLGGTFGFGQGLNFDLGFDDDLLSVSYPSGGTTQTNQCWGIYYLDNTGPMATISSTATSPTKNSPIPITVIFDEPLSLSGGYVPADHGVNNGTISNVVQVNGSVYTFDLTPTVTQGSVEYEVFAGAFEDYHHNLNQGSNYFTIAYDAVSPTVTITSGSSNPTSVSPIPVTFTFSESVSFNASNIAVVNGSAGNLQAISGVAYTADITPTGAGTVTVSVAANQVTDAAGNGNVASSNFTRTFTVADTTPPTVSITSGAANPTNVSPIPVTFTFSETVTGFVVGDITVSNGSAGTFAGSGAAYTANITPSGQGTVTVSIAANVAADGAANGNVASSNFTRVFDSAAPTVVITSGSADPTNTSPIPVTFTFSESVTGFVVGDISVSNGSAGTFSGSGTIYTANITPTGQGTVTVNVAANVAADGATNGNAASANFTRVFDSASPTVTISSSAANPTNASPIPVTITFSETVTGFVAGDIGVTGGSAGSFVAVSGTVYTANITPSGQGTVTVSVGSSVAADAATNSNTAATNLTRTFDSVAPTVSISSGASDPTNVSPIPVTFTFSETVTGFVVGDITVSNGSAGTFSGSGAVYTANITPSGQGTVTVSLAANVAADGATNGNSASSNFTRLFDSASPTVVVTSSSADPTNATPIPVTFTFSETVTGFVVGDISVSGGSAGSFVAVSGTVYTANITPSGQGTVTVGVSGNVAADGTANGNAASTNLTRVFDNVAPTVSLTSAASDPTNVSPIPITFTFSEAVTGFVVGDISVTNGSAGNFIAVSGTVYTSDITPSTGGTVTVSVSGAVAADAAGNTNAASSNLTRNFTGTDTTPPTVSISSASPDPTNVSPIPVTFTFSETVTGFIVGDITVVGGSAGTFVAVSGTTYTANITPSGQGTVTVSVAANVAADGAANGNTASATLSRIFDASAPTISITSAASNPTNTSPIPITFTFSEAVTGFVVGDITVTGGAAGGFAASSGSVYTANITPSGPGTVTVSVGANVAADAASNGNTAATNLTRTFDSVIPTIAISSTAGDPTNVSPIAVTFTFSETVTGFVVGDIGVANGSAGSFVAVSGTVYTANITPAGQGTVTISVATNVAADAASNGNASASSLTRSFDSTAPTVTITSPASEPTITSPIPVTFTFGETVSGFTIGDIAVTGGSAGNFIAVSGSSYTADITPSGPGTITVSVAANAASDGANNGNIAPVNFTRTFGGTDTTPPTLTITSTSADPTNVSPIPLTFTFSETVTGFAVGDITITGGTAGNFAAVSGTIYTASITPSAQGTITVNVAAGAAADAASNGNTASTNFTRLFDNAAPTVVLSSSAVSPTNVSPIPVTFTFSETVTGFVVGDITVSGGTASNFVATSGTVYTANIIPSTQGTITVSIAANSAADGASNGNTASASLSRIYDNVAPAVAITTTSLSPTDVAVIPVTITFSESVTGFVIGDMTIVNGAAGSFAAVSSTVYTVNVTATTPGNVTVSVPANVAVDAANNGNVASPVLTREFVIAKTNQLITFAEIAALTMGGPVSTLTASSTSGLAVTFTTTSDKVTLSGNQVTLVKSGSVTIKASQAGNATFNAAPDVSRTFCINPAKPAITLSQANTDTPLLTSNAAAGNQWFLNGSAVSGAVNPTFSPAAPGIYTVQVTVETCQSQVSADLPLVVTGDGTHSPTAELKLFPNPTHDELYLRWPQSGGASSVSIYEMDGKVIEQISTTRNELEVRTASYAQGQYFVVINTSEASHQLRFIKK